jgi:hypothetical protein
MKSARRVEFIGNRRLHPILDKLDHWIVKLGFVRLDLVVTLIANISAKPSVHVAMVAHQEPPRVSR